MLLVVAAGLAGLFGGTAYAALAGQVRAPRFSPYFGLRLDVVPVALTPARYHVLVGGLLGVALLAAGLGLATRSGRGSRGAKRSQPRAGNSWWGQFIRRGRGALARPWRWLRGPERALALALLAVVGAVRLYYAGYYPLSLDEVASYDYYVLPGAAVTGSYYPFPNNHIGANLLVGLVHALLPGAAPALALRLLPTLLGLATLPLVYALTLRHLRFGAATLGLGLYWLSPLAVYYAVAGRGYAWATLAALAGLFAALELLRPGARRPVRQLAWAVFGVSAVGGLYAVPTHLYTLLALGLGLLAGFSQAPPRVRRLKLAHLAVATLGVGAVAAVLYAPVGAVSGWPALLANRYVARHPWPEFRVGFGPWLLGTATELLGQRGLSAAAYVAVLGLAPVGLRWGGLPAPARRVGWLLLAQLGLWLLLAAAQRVYPPARTLLVALLAFFLVAALLGQVAWDCWVRPRRPLARPGAVLSSLALAGLLAAYGGYRLRREQVIIAQQTQQQAHLRAAYVWLQAQEGLRRVWVGPRAYAIFWQHYALSGGQRPLPLRVPSDAPGARPTGPGELAVFPGGNLPAGAPQVVRFRNAQVLVVAAPLGSVLPQ